MVLLCHRWTTGDVQPTAVARGQPSVGIYRPVLGADAGEGLSHVPLCRRELARLILPATIRCVICGCCAVPDCRVVGQLAYLGKGYFFSWWNVLDSAALAVAVPMAAMGGNGAVSDSVPSATDPATRSCCLRFRRTLVRRVAITRCQH